MHFYVKGDQIRVKLFVFVLFGLTLWVLHSYLIASYCKGAGYLLCQSLPQVKLLRLVSEANDDLCHYS